MIEMLVAAALAQGSPVSNPTWVETGRHGEEIIYIDTGNVEWRGNVARAWSWSRYPREQDNGVTADYFQNDYDCGRRTYSLVAFRRVGARGNVIEGAVIPEEMRQVESVVSGSAGEYELQLVCRR